MTTTLKDCVALGNTIHQLQSKSLPFKVGFKLNKIAKAIQDDYYTYVKTLNDVIKRKLKTLQRWYWCRTSRR